jgi:transcription elongation factor/antiterminator RfaH
MPIGQNWRRPFQVPCGVSFFSCDNGRVVTHFHPVGQTCFRLGSQLASNLVFRARRGLQMTQENACAPSVGPKVLTLAEQERWYVARTLPQRELYAARQLANQGFRSFVPRYLKNRRHARKVETISAPLFPRYIFVVVDRTRDRWRSINGTLGVDRLLMYGGEPQPVPHGVVENLIAAADLEGNVRFDVDLKEGQTVKVMAGPFADLVGQLECLDDNGRVRVLLEILGGKVRVALPQKLVAPAKVA